MSEEEKIELSPGDGKTESLPDLPAGPEEVHDESEPVSQSPVGNRETPSRQMRESNVNDEATHQTSDITTLDIPNM